MDKIKPYEQFFASGSIEKAMVSVHKCIESDPNNAELWNDAGVILYSMGKIEDALMCFEEARALGLDSEELNINLEKAFMGAPESKKKRIAFFCGADGMTFLNSIMPFIKERFEVRFFEGNTPQQMQDLMEWSDVSWFEWCTNLAAVGSRLKKVCRNIIRLHRYEAYVGWSDKINWENIDTLVTVGNSFVDRQLKRVVPNLEQKTSIVTIANGVDLEKFSFRERPRGKNLAFVANLRPVKNPMLLVECMTRLCRIDSQYRLFMAGREDDPAIRQYLEYTCDDLGLSDNIIFQGWQDDINSWLDDKHYIVCTSIIESQGMGILEAMARGIKPVIHNYPGSKEVFSEDFVFTTSDQFCEHILDADYNPSAYRMFVEERYPLSHQLDEVYKLLTGQEKGLTDMGRLARERNRSQRQKLSDIYTP